MARIMPPCRPLRQPASDLAPGSTCETQRHRRRAAAPGAGTWAITILILPSGIRVPGRRAGCGRSPPHSETTRPPSERERERERARRSDLHLPSPHLHLKTLILTCTPLDLKPRTCIHRAPPPPEDLEPRTCIHQTPPPPEDLEPRTCIRGATPHPPEAAGCSPEHRSCALILSRSSRLDLLRPTSNSRPRSSRLCNHTPSGNFPSRGSRGQGRSVREAPGRNTGRGGGRLCPAARSCGRPLGRSWGSRPSFCMAAPEL
jgi:hypothetical protein